jgi:hypothetical protein
MPNINQRNSEVQSGRNHRHVRTAVSEYKRRGWKPIPIKGNRKNPNDLDWQIKNYSEDDFGPFKNVGIQFGQVSGGLADVDLDCDECIDLADDFLPPTDAMFGRRSKPAAHRLFVSDLHESEKTAALQFKDTNGKMLVELRIGGDGKGALSVFPPSIHPDSGQLIEWEQNGNGDPTQIEGKLLKQRVADLATAALLVRHYPAEGGRHDAALVIGGVLARANFDAEDLERFVASVARLAGDEEVDKRVEAAVAAIDLLQQRQEVPGVPRLAQVFGGEVANKAAEWLGLTPSRPARRGSQNLHSWDDPDISLLDDRRGELPKFPLGLLASEKLQAWTERAALGSGTSIDHVIVPTLGIASALIGCSRQVQATRSWLNPFTMWTAIIGFSGSGKTPGLGVPRSALDTVVGDNQNNVVELKRQHEQRVEVAKVRRERWKAAVKKAQEDGQTAPAFPAEAESPGAFVPPLLYTSDTTIEQLEVQLQARPQGMLFLTDEISRLFLNMSRYSAGEDNQFWLEAWDGKPFHQQRLGRNPVDLDHLLVGVVGGMQPDKLAKCFKGAADGMYARIVFSWPEPPPYRPLRNDIEPTEVVITKAFERLAFLADRPDHSGKIPLSDKARREFEQLRKKVMDDAATLDGREREWWSKIPAHALRLAGTLTYLNWAIDADDNEREPAKILREDMSEAVELVFDYFWPHARAALRQIGLNQHHADARRVLKWISASGKEQIGREQIRRDALGKRLDAEAAQEVLDYLERAGWLRQQKSTTGGRPNTRWAVNPKLGDVCVE